jgi:hypothetical protein
MARWFVRLEELLVVAGHLGNIGWSGSSRLNNRIHAAVGQVTTVSCLGEKEEPERRLSLLSRRSFEIWKEFRSDRLDSIQVFEAEASSWQSVCQTKVPQCGKHQ